VVKTLNITLDDETYRDARQVKDDLGVTWPEFVEVAADELGE
jgi:hypothetical protein